MGIPLVKAAGRSTIAAAILAISLASSTNAAAWTEPLPLGPWGSDSPQIVPLGGRHVLAAFVNFQGNLIVRRSADDGASWRPRVKVPTINDEPAAYELAGNGRFVDVVWSEEMAGQICGDHLCRRISYLRSTNRGDTFKSRVSLTPRAAGLLFPTVVRDDASHVVVAWFELSGPTSDTLVTLKMRVSHDEGLSFGPALEVDRRLVGNRDEEWSYSMWPGMAIADGVLYIAYALSSGDLRVRRSLDWGATWGPRKEISTRARGQRAMIAADGADLYVAYEVPRSELRYRRSTDAGQSWSAPMSLFSGKGWNPVMIAGNGHVDLVFTQDGGDWWEFWLVYRHSTDGTHWSAPKKLGHGTMSPSMARTATRLLLAFNDWNGGDVGRVTRAMVMARLN